MAFGSRLLHLNIVQLTRLAQRTLGAMQPHEMSSNADCLLYEGHQKSMDNQPVLTIIVNSSIYPLKVQQMQVY